MGHGLDRDCFSEQSDTLQITAPISEGSSGSPVCDENGYVIGVAKSGLNNAQNINFAVPINMALFSFNGGLGLDPSPSWDTRPMTEADNEHYQSEPPSTAPDSSASPKATNNNGQNVDTGHSTGTYIVCFQAQPSFPQLQPRHRSNWGVIKLTTLT
jgi:S1-C subfamily serine protease